MKLIRELNESCTYLTEDVGGKKRLYIEGCFLQANIKNRNGRIYPMPILEREVNRYHSDLIAGNRAMGELGHPNGPQLNLDRVSHLVKECKRNGNDFIGKALILDTPMGKIAESLIQAEARLGVSSRGMGSLKEDSKLGGSVVQNDFQLHVMIDIVADPSAPSAWVNGIMEGIEWTQTPTGEWQANRIDEIRQQVHNTPSSMLAEQKVKIFEAYIEDLLETQMIDQLSKTAGVDRSIALDAVRRAKVKARITGGAQNDARYVYHAARGILGLGGR